MFLQETAFLSNVYSKVSFANSLFIFVTNMKLPKLLHLTTPLEIPLRAFEAAWVLN